MGNSCIAVRSLYKAGELGGTQGDSTLGAAPLDNFITLLYTIRAVGAVAQMGERINRTDEVRGSSPLSSTRGAVAKLGSRLNGIEKVEGSSPSGSTF